MVVTRVFQLRHVGVASVVSLLQNMKLSVAISAIEETQTLFVTCYAHRMGADRAVGGYGGPAGQPQRVSLPATEAHHSPIHRPEGPGLGRRAPGHLDHSARPLKTPPAADRSSRRTKNAAETASTSATSARAVYLDTDDRTNRVLMIGYKEQLETVEGLIDISDIPQQDQPILKQYKIRHVSGGGRWEAECPGRRRCGKSSG